MASLDDDDEQIDRFLAEAGPGGHLRHTTTGELLAMATAWGESGEGTVRSQGRAVLLHAARRMAAIEGPLV